MEMFVSQTLLAEQKARARRSTLVFRLFAAGMLLTFVTMCLLTRTANARTMFISMLAFMIPAGMICILLYSLRVRPDRAAVKHAETLLAGETETAEGVFRFAGGPVQIPGSVRVLPVILQDGEATRRLHLDETLAGCMPAEGTRVRVQTVSRYITGAEILSGSEDTPERSMRPEPKRHPVRRALSLVPAFVLWAMIAVVFGGFVFNRITDTAAEYKIVIYADCTVTDGAVLADMLESALTAPVRMVKVHPFDYAMFGSEAIRTADMYIIPVSRRKNTASGWYRAGFRYICRTARSVPLPPISDTIPMRNITCITAVRPCMPPPMKARRTTRLRTWRKDCWKSPEN